MGGVMSLLDKYLNESKIEEASKVYKSLSDRINRAKSTKEITAILGDLKKATAQEEVTKKEALKLADQADDALEDL
jgi:hypothetical protein